MTNIQASEVINVTEDETIVDSQIQVEQEVVLGDSDGSLDDSINSIEVRKVLDGISLSGDLRTSYYYTNLNNEKLTDGLVSRWRIRSEIGLLPSLRAVGRVAGLCSTEECSANFVLENFIPSTNSMNEGDITLDEAYLHWFRLNKFDLAIGRMQTKFVANGGVFAKSLDRNDSNNVNINWTDGMHATYRADNNWISNLILQHNSSNGPTNIRRGPLDFDDPSAKISYVLGFENRTRTRYILQRELDITYLPATLLKNGSTTEQRTDYYGVVIRGAGRWPERDEGIRLRVATEIGYAPKTQTKAAARLSGDGDVNGLGWNIALSLMDIKPNHSVGFNYGRVGAGWLISPQFRQNESLSEIRYQWRKNSQLAFDFRVRNRKELDQRVMADHKLSEWDLYLRFTWGGSLK